MGTLFPEQHPSQIPLRLSYPLKGGVEVRIDVRLACLAAALTAASPPSPSEHPLVTSTRNYLASYANHPSVSWLAETIEQVWLLGLAMKTVQLGPPPVFQPHPWSRCQTSCSRFLLSRMLRNYTTISQHSGKTPGSRRCWTSRRLSGRR